MISPSCASALALSTVEWLASQQLPKLLHSCAGLLSVAQESPEAPANVEAMAAACACLGAIAAGASLVTAYLQASSLSRAAFRSEHSGDDAGAAADAQGGVQRQLEGLLEAAGLFPSAGAGIEGSGKVQPLSTPPSVAAARVLMEAVVECSRAWMPGTPESFLGAAAANLAVTLSQMLTQLLIHSQPPAPSRQAVLVRGPLEPLITPAAVQHLQQLAGVAATGDSSTVFQPWDAFWLQQTAHFARAAVHAAAHHTGSAASVHVALASLQLLPPGDESTALQAFYALLAPSQLERLTAVARGSAAGARAAHDLPGEPMLPSAESMSATLVPGYAAVWLGLVAEGASSGEVPLPAADDSGGAVGSASAPLPPMLCMEGSRLPLAPLWPLLEVPLHPNPHPTPSASDAVAAGPESQATPAQCIGATLLLALGLESLPALEAVERPRGDAFLSSPPLGDLLTGGGSWATVPAAQKAKAAIRLVFCRREVEWEAWHEATVQWALGALMHMGCRSGGGALSEGKYGEGGESRDCSQ
jgi:hypothetical protein